MSSRWWDQLEKPLGPGWGGGAGCGGSQEPGLEASRPGAPLSLAQDIHTVSCCPLSLSGLLRDGLFPVPQSLPARGPARVLCRGGRARLRFSERAEHGVWGPGLQQRLAGAADLHRRPAGQLVSTPAADGLLARDLGLNPLSKDSFSGKIYLAKCGLNLALPEQNLLKGKFTTSYSEAFPIKH